MWEASTVSFPYVFLRDVVTLWVNSVFFSLLIANEGLHWWLFLSDIANHFWGRVVVFIRPPSVCRNFLWLVAALFPGLSLSFASGLSSTGLICCLAMGLRYADLLYLWLWAHSCWTKGFMAFLPVLRSTACSGYASSCGFSSPIWFTTFAMGSPLRGRGKFVLDRNKGLVCFLFPFWAVSLCCHCPSGYSHLMGQVCWSAPTYARPPVVVGASPFLLLDGL